jgi:hypothetical protein
VRAEKQQNYEKKKSEEGQDETSLRRGSIPVVKSGRRGREKNRVEEWRWLKKKSNVFAKKKKKRKKEKRQNVFEQIAWSRSRAEGERGAREGGEKTTSVSSMRAPITRKNVLYLWTLQEVAGCFIIFGWLRRNAVIDCLIFLVAAAGSAKRSSTFKAERSAPVISCSL